MFRNVLVGVDGRQGGPDAIALARRLAAPDSALTLAHVCGADWFIARGAGMAVAYEREATEQLLRSEKALAEVDADLASAAFAPAGRGLHELAEERNGDLLVVGSSRDALLGRVLLGDDARAALDGAPCAIAIAPRGYLQSQHALTKLGVGYDGSPVSKHALAAARELARQHAAQIHALHVVSLQDVREERPIPADWPATAAELVERAREELRDLDGIEAQAVYRGSSRGALAVQRSPRSPSSAPVVNGRRDGSSIEASPGISLGTSRPRCSSCRATGAVSRAPIPDARPRRRSRQTPEMFARRCEPVRRAKG